MSALRLSLRRERRRLRSGQALARRFAGIAAILVWSVTAAAQSPAPSAPPDQSFDSNGVRIRYVEQGQGPAIVLMHGYTGTLDRHFIANGVFANLAKDYRVIAMDLRGHGKSDKLPFKSLVVALQAPGAKPPSDDEIRKTVAPLVAANDVRAFAALWRGYKTLIVSNQQLKAVRVPSMVLIGSDDISAAGVPELNKTHPQIRTLVVPGAQHGGPEGVMRRPEFMTALREFLANAR